MVQVFEVSANDNGQITSVMAEDDIVVFTTDAGTIAGMMPDRPYQLWRFKATGGINGPAIYSNRNYFFSSRDTYIYCINRSRGELVWKYLAGAILTDAPEVTDDYVYQHVAGHGLLAIDKKTGQLAWKLKEGIDLLAEDGRKVYVMAENNKIVVMDNKKLEKINEIDAPEVTNWITNTVDSMMYLADESGRIMCVKPIEY
jgi:outer membrane protein assembly factor BamB